MRYLLILSTYLIVCVTCLGQSTKEILFVGNSLTYTNDLPVLVEKAAKAKDIKVKATMLAYPNYAIVDHLDEGVLHKYLQKNRYDYVIIQQGPSSQSEGRRMLIEDGAVLKKLCEEYSAELAYFMVWPSRQYYYTFDGVIKNHRDAALKNEAILCPVGERWKAHFDATDDFSYYGPDGFHPSMAGSKIAAQVIVDSIFKDE